MSDSENVGVCDRITVGNNVVNGGGALVPRDILERRVAAGISAKQVITLDEYKAKVMPKAVRIRQLNYAQKRDLLLKHLT